MVYNRVRANTSVVQVKIHGLEDSALYRVELCGTVPAYMKKAFPFLGGSDFQQNK